MAGYDQVSDLMAVAEIDSAEGSVGVRADGHPAVMRIAAPRHGLHVYVADLQEICVFCYEAVAVVVVDGHHQIEQV